MKPFNLSHPGACCTDGVCTVFWGCANMVTLFCIFFSHPAAIQLSVNDVHIVPHLFALLVMEVNYTHNQGVTNKNTQGCLFLRIVVPEWPWTPFQEFYPVVSYNCFSINRNYPLHSLFLTSSLLDAYLLCLADT